MEPREARLHATPISIQHPSRNRGRPRRLISSPVRRWRTTPIRAEPSRPHAGHLIRGHGNSNEVEEPRVYIIKPCRRASLPSLTTVQRRLVTMATVQRDPRAANVLGRDISSADGRLRRSDSSVGTATGSAHSREALPGFGAPPLGPVSPRHVRGSAPASLANVPADPTTMEWTILLR